VVNGIAVRGFGIQLLLLCGRRAVPVIWSGLVIRSQDESLIHRFIFRDDFAQNCIIFIIIRARCICSYVFRSFV